MVGKTRGLGSHDLLIEPIFEYPALRVRFKRHQSLFDAGCSHATEMHTFDR